MVRDASSMKTFLKLFRIFSDIMDQATTVPPFLTLERRCKITGKMCCTMTVGSDRLLSSLILAYVGKEHEIPPFYTDTTARIYDYIYCLI